MDWDEPNWIDADEVERWTPEEVQLNLSFYQGFRQGYNVREGLEKLRRRSREGDVKGRIADLCIRHPDWSTKQIFIALDDANVRLRLHGHRHQKAKSRLKPQYWADVADDPAYKMLVSRIRDKMQREARLINWEKLMNKIAKLQKALNDNLSKWRKLSSVEQDHIARIITKSINAKS